MSHTEKKVVHMDVAQDVFQYRTVSFDVPENASKENIIEKAKQVALNETRNEMRLSQSGVDMETGRRLRIADIECDNETIAESITVEKDDLSISFELLDAAKRLKFGQATESQFILDTLKSMLRNAPNDAETKEVVSPEFVGYYAEAALRDTWHKVNVLINQTEPSGNIVTDQMVLTIKMDDGEVENRSVRSPGIIMGHGEPLPVYHPFKNAETGETALVFRDLSKTEEPDPVTAIYADGSKKVFESVTEFNKTGLLRMNDYEEGQSVIHQIEPLIDRPARDVRFAGKPYSTEKTEVDDMIAWGGYRRPE